MLKETRWPNKADRFVVFRHPFCYMIHTPWFGFSLE